MSKAPPAKKPHHAACSQSGKLMARTDRGRLRWVGKAFSYYNARTTAVSVFAAHALAHWRPVARTHAADRVDVASALVPAIAERCLKGAGGGSPRGARTYTR